MTEPSQTTPGKYRHLVQCSSPTGHFNLLALDHRGNLLNSLNQTAGHLLSDAEFTQFKREVMQYLLPAATGVLTDPDYGFAPALNIDNDINIRIGLLAPLEVTDYSLHASRRVTEFIEGWSVAQIKRAGASGVKLLLYYHPDAANAAQQRALVRQVVAQCTEQDIPFFLEPITYSLDFEKPLSSPELRQIVIENARTFSAMGIDVLKSEFPLDVQQEPDESAWRAALEALNVACRVPWTLLSAGVEYTIFRRQAELACRAGASGVIVGRAVWAEAVALSGDARTEFLRTVARQRMEELSVICTEHAASWHQRISPPKLTPGWYKR